MCDDGPEDNSEVNKDIGASWLAHLISVTVIVAGWL